MERIEMFKLMFFYRTFLPDKRYVTEALQLAVDEPALLDQLISELDGAADLLNKYKEDDGILINANKLKKLLGQKMKLPKVVEVFHDLINWREKDKLLINRYIGLFGKFKFIYEMSNPKQLFACILLASYRTYMLTKYPFLEKKKAQVASALEEMFAIMAIKGSDTRLFQATKHWIKDWQKEGFSEKLAGRIKNL